MAGQQEQLSIGGFYYVALDRADGTVEGQYYDPHDVKAPPRFSVNLMLEPKKAAGGRSLCSWPEATLV